MAGMQTGTKCLFSYRSFALALGSVLAAYMYWQSSGGSVLCDSNPSPPLS
ncbi:rCG48644, partial [Rattus norvegicus]